MMHILNDHERGLLVRQGRVVAWLEPGSHRTWRKHTEVRRIDIDRAFAELTPELATLMPHGAGEELVVPHAHVALVSVDGRPFACLVPGRWVLWQLRAEVTAKVVSTDGVIANESVPEAFRALVPKTYMTTLPVAAHERVPLFVDGALDRVLTPGSWAIWTVNRRVTVETVDVREREIQIVGQDVITADKVTIRLNAVVTFSVADAEKSVRAVANVETAIYTEAQMALRRWIGGATVDQILERRSDARSVMRAELAERAASWGVAIAQIDLKDVVLPGEMRTILNQVIEAEKRAAANVILRREETAATRSLMNTAKLLEQNPMLLRLKELEAYKEIAEKVDQMTIIAAPQELAARLSLTGAARGG